MPYTAEKGVMNISGLGLSFTHVTLKYDTFFWARYFAISYGHKSERGSGFMRSFRSGYTGFRKESRPEGVQDFYLHGRHISPRRTMYLPARL